MTPWPNDEMHASPALRKFLKEFESGGTNRPILRIEDDCLNNPTIGYGHKVQPGQMARFAGQTITVAEAESIFSVDVANAERAVRSLVNVPLEQNQFDGLVSYAFNAGSGGLQKSGLAAMVNVGSLEAQSKAFMSNTVGLGGLAIRRYAETAMYMKNEYWSFRQAVQAWKNR